MAGPRKPAPGRVSRRDFIKRVGAAVPVATGLAACGSSMPDGGRGPGRPGENVFRHGVASGDPLADRVILWTRLTPAGGGDVAVTIEVARDPGMSDVVGVRQSLARAERDFTVKVDFDGLLPATTYYYRFHADGFRSPVGRTKTLPSGSVDHVRMAVCACSSLAHGFFNAYRRIAERADLDVVLHLGDYIYEYATGKYGDVREYEPPTEIVTLEDYRTRYGQYRSDPDLQEVHRQHPFIVIWDDHELADNTWLDGAKNHIESDGQAGHNADGQGGQGCWVQRRAFAIQAYREWLPIRDELADYIAPQSCDENEVDVTRRRLQERIWRRFRFGDLIDLTMLDGRLYGREIARRPNIVPAMLEDTPSCNSANDVQDAGLFAGCAPPFTDDYQLLGGDQEQWLLDGLRDSDTRWRIIGQQFMFAQLQIVGLPVATCHLPSSSDVLNLLQDLDPRGPLGQLVGGVARALPEISASTIFLNADQWDGYPVARRRIMDFIAAHQIDNVVVLTGDIHSSWANDLTPDPSNPLAYNPLNGNGSIGVEFVCTSVTSPGLDALNAISDLIPAVNPHMKYIDLARKGYLVLDVTPERCQGEWWYVDSILDPADEGQAFGRAFEARDGSNRLVAAAGPSAGRPSAPPLAP